MANKEFTHIDAKGNPSMVDVGSKTVTQRLATAIAKVKLQDEVLHLFADNEITTKKGPVFQTAILAGIMAAKKTSDLIPLCHPLQLNKCEVEIELIKGLVEIECTVGCNGKTGVEMEALTGASVAALTIYDMCKAFGHNIEILETRLIQKSGGQNDFDNRA